MALPPIQGKTLPPTASPKPPPDTRAAGQRAFFQAALNKAGATTATIKAVAQPASAPSRALQPTVTRLQDESTIPSHPGRLLRPGSLVDIKV